jgi:CBS domain-containing protein
MLKAKDIMTREIISVHPETTVIEAAQLMLAHHINGLPVVDAEGHPEGIICQSDLITQQKKIPIPSFFMLLGSAIPLQTQHNISKEVQKMAAIKVMEAMTAELITVDSESPLEEVATLMVNSNIHTLPVVDHDKLVGIIGKEDILRTLMPGEKSK